MALHQPLSLAYGLSGFVIGLLVGLTGVGGGSLMTPLLVLLFRFHPATAIGTDLLYAATTKTAGTLVHGAIGTVEWRLVGLLAAGSVPGTLATLAVLAAMGPLSRDTAHLLSVMLGAALLLTAASLILRDWLMGWAERRHLVASGRRAAILTIILGLYLGVFVTISSVGAGAIGVTALILLYPRLPTARIVGSDIAHAVPLTLIAGIGHWLIGSVDWHLYASLVAGSIPGVVIGSLIGTRVSERVLRPLLALILVVVGIRLIG
jgi:uncharacterized membrane protein YfcA